MANGVLVSHATSGGRTTWVWQRDRPDGAVPRDGDARPLRPDDLDDVGRHPVVRRRRPAAREGPGALEAAGDRRRSTRRSTARTRSTPSARSSTTREGRRLLARDADEAGLRPTCRTRRRSSHELSHMWFGDSVTLTAVARHLAARGLRHLVGVDLERVPGQQDRPRSGSSSSTTRPRRTRAFWTPPPAIPGTPAFLFNGTIYYRGGDDAAGAAREGRRLRVLPDHARLGDAEPLRQRDDAAVHRARRAGLAAWTWTTSSTSGSTSRTSRPSW